MESIEPFEGTTNIGCRLQVARAKSNSQTIQDVIEADLAVYPSQENRLFDAVTEYKGCDCRISENGCIDPSACRTNHVVYSLPYFYRWCDRSTCHIKGGGALVLWSGWARPSALKLLGRYPTVEQVLSLVKRSHSSTLHTSWKYTFEIVHDANNNRNLIKITSDLKNGTRALTKLKTLSPNLRFGEHTLPRINVTE